MKGILVYPYGNTPALISAARLLASRGVECTFEPDHRVTHLLLSVPSLDPSGDLRGGGKPEEVLARLPSAVTVVGGMLEHPVFSAHSRVDLLGDAYYVAENAALTADCALRLASDRLPLAWKGCPVLIVGWGRIGKCLARLLQNLEAEVAVSARREENLALLTALGYEAIAPEVLTNQLPRFRVVFNTVPAPVLKQTPDCAQNLWIDLASCLGLEGENVLWARGLPGKMLPESSGKLIGSSLLRLLQKGGGQ